MNKLIVVLWILFILYMLVFMAISADLWSGLRKAKKRGEARTSYGLRITIDKLSRYYNLLIILTIIDAMQISGIWYLNTYYNYAIPIFPIITFIGSLGLGFIELKSIYEKAEDKEMGKAAKLASTLLSDDKNVKAILEFFNTKQNKNETKTKA